MTTRRKFLVSTGLLAVSAAIPVLTPRNSAKMWACNIVLQNGDVYWMRASRDLETGRISRFFSFDGGLTWVDRL